MEHDIHLGFLGEYHVPWVDQSLYSPHQKSSMVYQFQHLLNKIEIELDKLHKYNF